MEKLFIRNREDRDALAHRRLEVHAGEADRRVAPHVHAELVGFGEFRAHRESEAVAELGGLAPADVGERRRALPERGYLVARAAGVVGDDGVVDVHRLMQFVEYPVRIERRLVVGAPGLPLGEPLRLDGRDAWRAPWSLRCSACVRSRPSMACERWARQSCASPIRAYCAGHVLVEVHGVEGRVDDGLAARHGYAETREGEAAAHTEDDVRFGEERLHRTRIRAAAGPEGQGMVLREGALALETGRDGDVPTLRRSAFSFVPTPRRSARPWPA